jgi:hypothetical protein
MSAPVYKKALPDTVLFCRMSFASCRILNSMWPKNLYSRVGNIEQVMALAIGEPFNYPVDLTLYPDYMLEIEYPMDFRQILANI